MRVIRLCLALTRKTCFSYNIAGLSLVRKDNRGRQSWWCHPRQILQAPQTVNNGRTAWTDVTGTYEHRWWFTAGRSGFITNPQSGSVTHSLALESENWAVSHNVWADGFPLVRFFPRRRFCAEKGVFILRSAAWRSIWSFNSSSELLMNQSEQFSEHKNSQNSDSGFLHVNLVSFLLSDSKLNIFVLWAEQDVWGRRFWD